MASDGVSKIAREAISDLKAGLDLLVEVEIILTERSVTAEVVRSVIEKQKLAVSYIQRSTILTRDIMRKSKESAELLRGTIE